MRLNFKTHLFFFVCCIFCSIELNAQNSDLDSLWNKTVRPYLEYPLWQKRDIYDAGHYLMVPLHGAYKLNKTEWQDDFYNHFKRFLENKDDIAEGRLNKVHYYYLMSQFVVLSKKHNRYSNLVQTLYKYLYSKIDSLWNYEKAWQWDRESFSSMRERTYWKLDKTVEKKKTYSYYKGIIDETMFTIAIAADLKYYLYISDKPKSEVLDSIHKIGIYIHKKRVVWQDDGGWLFQPGVWFDHRDYAYAGNVQVTHNLKPKRKKDIAEDASHSHRLPLWLKSLYQSSTKKEDRRYLKKLIKGLRTQFINDVLVYPNKNYPYYRTNNYMDGWNGVYRYNYETYKQSTGHGPYSLSGTILLGWWSFLETKKMSRMYKDIYLYPPDIISIYKLKEKSLRKRNPIVSEFYENGLLKLTAILSTYN